MRQSTINALTKDNSEYPIMFYTASDFRAQENILNRVIPFHQILLILDGKGTLFYNGKSYKIQKGNAFFTAKGTRVEYINEGGLTTAYLTAKGLAADSLAENHSDNGLLFFENVELEKYVAWIKRLICDYRNGCDQGTLSIQAYSFFVDFLSQKKSDVPLWLDETIKYIHLHFDKKLTLAELADHAYVSVSKLCHEFRRYYSMTVFDYLMNVRLRYARDVFQTYPKTTTKEVAAQCGFHDTGYFCRAYKKKYRKTPSEEKKQNWL